MNVNQIIETNQPSQDRGRDQNKWKPTWTVVNHLVAIVRDGTTLVEQVKKENFKDVDGHAAVQIWQSDHRAVQFSRFSLGTIVGDRFVPSISPRVEGVKTRNPRIDSGHWEAVFQLLEAAKAWQQEDAVYQADKYVDRTSGPVQVTQKHTGKTDRARAKGKARPKANP